MAKGENLKLQEVSERIADSILADNYLSKDKMVSKILLLLKTWIKVNDRAKYDKVKTDKGRLVWTIERTEFQHKFWLNKVRELVSEDQIKELYQEINKSLKENGY